MSTIEYYSDINLKGNEVKDFVIDKVTSLPTTDKVGKIVYLSTAVGSDAAGLYIYNGSAWVLYGGASDVQALTARVDTIEGYSTAYTSGITSALVAQIGTNSSDIDALETAVGDNTTGSETGIYGLIATNSTAISGLDGRLDTAESDIDALETKVGDNSSGLVKDVAGLKTAVGDASSGLVKDVDDLETRLGMTDSSGVSKRVYDLENAGYITKAVNDLTNYYLKSETYTKGEIDNAIAAVTQFKLELVDTLPTTGQKANTIYLVPSANAQDDNVKDEYLWINNGWEQIGSTAFSLNIAQGTSAISINSEVLQTASASQIGLLSSSDFSRFASKQDALTYDSVPTADSQNMVKSGAIYTALAAKQDNLTFDSTPTSESNNPVKSGGVYTALAGKVDVNANTSAQTGLIKVNTDAQGLVTGGATTIASSDISDFGTAVLGVIKGTTSKVIYEGGLSTSGTPITHNFGELPSAVTIYNASGEVIYAQVAATTTQVTITPSEALTNVKVVIKI